MDREKVIEGFTICSEYGLLTGEDCHGHYEFTDNLMDIIKVNDYSKQCPYNGCNTGCVKTLAKDVLALLNEQQSLLGIQQTADGITFLSTGTAKQGEERGLMLGQLTMHDWLKKELLYRGLLTDEIRAVFDEAKRI